VYNSLNHHQAPSKIADLEPLRDMAPAVLADQSTFLGRLSRGAGHLRHWLSRGRDDRLARFQPEPLDDHTLSDIGVPRIETLYWDPKKRGH
jgi:uncharacterized protein YjiS (DUF1127 family)